MVFIFDHLIAILVGATLLGALLFIQQRGQQSSFETTLRHRTETQTTAFMSTLSRDLENARTSRQITTGLGRWVPDEISNWGSRAFGIHGSDTHTDWIEFVTLADPNQGGNSPLQAVGYRTVATGDSATVGDIRQALFRVERYVYEAGATDWVQRGGSPPNLTSFSVRANRLNGSVVTNGRLGDVPASFEIVMTTTEASVGQKTADQAATALTNSTRQAQTVRVVNANSTGTASGVAPTGGPTSIPLFPGISPPPPKDPPGSSSGYTAGDDDDDRKSDGGSSGGASPPPSGPDLSGLTL